MLANLMHTMQIQIAQYINSIYGGVTDEEEFNAPLPVHPESETAQKLAFGAMHNAKQSNELEKLHKRRKNWLQVEINAIPIDRTSEIKALDDKTYDIDNKILQVEYEMGLEIKVHWTKKNKGYGNNMNKHMETE